MRIGITGEKGFIGKHLTHYFQHVLNYEVVTLGRDYIKSFSKVGPIDWLIHAAFIHRDPIPEKVLVLNKELTNTTLEGLKTSGLKCNIVFLSSIHEDYLTSYYGQAKKEARLMLETYCKVNNKQFISFKLPNVFGKWAMPNKTSFIATFCYNLHHNIEIQYNQNQVKLCYVEDAIKIIGSLKNAEVPYTETTVDKVYFLLKSFKKLEATNKLPQLKSKLEVDLYTTYKDYEGYKIKA